MLEGVNMFKREWDEANDYHGDGSEFCPECGGLIKVTDIPQTLESPAEYYVECTKCEWEME